MKNAAKTLALTCPFGLLLAGAAAAQTSGRIRYEVTQRIDPSQLHIVINGQVAKPGSPDFPTADIPDSRTFGMSLAFAGNYAREQREGGAMRTLVGGPNAAPQNSVVKRPFEETTYLDLAGRATTTVLTVKKDAATTAYRSDAPYLAPTGWTMTGQTKKIAGYTCRKATAPFRKETYTVWVTTELPFTYSPVRELMPDRGVVLALEGEREQYQATKIDPKPVPEAEVRPTQTAQIVTPAELKDLREKAQADFRQRLMEDLRN